MTVDYETLHNTNSVVRNMLDGHDAQRQAASILRLLQKREVLLTREQREKIETCTDLETLERWFDAAITATSAADVFE